jgi:hypothetical protein
MVKVLFAEGFDNRHVHKLFNFRADCLTEADGENKINEKRWLICRSWLQKKASLLTCPTSDRSHRILCIEISTEYGSYRHMRNMRDLLRNLPLCIVYCKRWSDEKGRMRVYQFVFR